MDKILVVDDERSMRDFLSIMLKKAGYDVTTAVDGEEAVKILHKDIFDLVITDLKMPKVDGLQVLKTVKELSPDTVVIVITAFASTETTVEAMKEGAYDYITKPFQNDEMKIRIKKALEKRRLIAENILLKKELKNRAVFDNIVGKSEKMEKVFELVRKVSDSMSNILIYGESGTGKELIARAIHFNSRKKDKPFVTINCGALPEGLLESELFGHMKGSFTGAVFNKEGLFEVANGGTIFLDEVGETSPAIQVKLLRVIQDKEFKRVGGTKEVKVDVRIITATNRDLSKAVAEGKFREDLYYRLNVIPITLPSLRERTDDIPLLADHFLNKFNKALNKNVKGFSQTTMELFRNYEWRGNVRELENVIERAVALSNSEIVTPEYLPDILRDSNRSSSAIPVNIPQEGLDLEGLIGDIERELLLKALEKTNWIKKDAAKLLHLNFRSFRYRLDKYNLNKKPLGKEAAGI
ncbi:MAG: sigma-54-dependent Fis family transcriptional regulator [Nitrospirae bacterium]|nr:sigma-54-dependent Fis family transcriptional regulator [Nitrospirota bacterium]